MSSGDYEGSTCEGTEVVHSSYVKDTTAEILRLRSALDAARAALREHAIVEGYCHECRTLVDDNGEPERHAPGCLAARSGEDKG